MAGGVEGEGVVAVLQPEVGVDPTAEGGSLIAQLLGTIRFAEGFVHVSDGHSGGIGVALHLHQGDGRIEQLTVFVDDAVP